MSDSYSATVKMRFVQLDPSPIEIHSVLENHAHIFPTRAKLMIEVDGRIRETSVLLREVIFEDEKV